MVCLLFVYFWSVQYTTSEKGIVFYSLESEALLLYISFHPFIKMDMKVPAHLFHLCGEHCGCQILKFLEG